MFLPKDIDLDSTEMDETEREVEYFKRYANQFSCRKCVERVTIAGAVELCLFCFMQVLVLFVLHACDLNGQFPQCHSLTVG